MEKENKHISTKERYPNPKKQKIENICRLLLLGRRLLLLFGHVSKHLRVTYRASLSKKRTKTSATSVDAKMSITEKRESPIA